MKLVVLGGGGFRVPLVHGALLAGGQRPVTEVVLHDVDPHRLRVIEAVLREQASGRPDAPRVWATTDLDEALVGADIVFVAVRVGGLVGRTVDERVAVDLGLLGQETTGAGGVAYGLRTVPVVLDVAERIARLAPESWVVNFTNPAGVVTEAMQAVLGDRVIGICDSPTGLVRRAATALALPPDEVEPGYVGLNHLGWLRALRHGGRDHLPDLIARPGLLATFEEGRLFGPERIAEVGAIPNEYLYYYESAPLRIPEDPASSPARTRGEYLRAQQEQFYAEAGARPEDALALWREVRAERDATYMAEARDDDPRDPEDIALGGYEEIALLVLDALTSGVPTTLVLGVRNAGSISELPDDAVVEVPARVDARGAHPLRQPPVHGRMLDLLTTVKEVEQLVIEAGRTRSARVALEAFARHPLVDSRESALALLTAYREQHPELADLR